MSKKHDELWDKYAYVPTNKSTEDKNLIGTVIIVAIACLIAAAGLWYLIGWLFGF